jgi:hypothetical protein
MLLLLLLLLLLHVKLLLLLSASTQCNWRFCSSSCGSSKLLKP